MRFCRKACLAMVLMQLFACIKPINSRQSSSPAASTNPASTGPLGTISEATNQTVVTSGNLAISIGEELAASITVALVASGLTEAQASAVSQDVKATGVLAIDTGANLHLSDAFGLSEQDSVLTSLAPKIAAAFVAHLDGETAGLDEATRKTAMAVITRATLKFTSNKDLTDEARLSLLGGVTQAVLSQTAEASLSEVAAIEAIGLVADASFGGMSDAAIKPEQFVAAAQSLAGKIGSGLEATGLKAEKIPAAMSLAAEKASAALGRLALTDATATIAATTTGFVEGLSASPQLLREHKTAAIAEVPRGVNTAVPNWLPPQERATAVERVTDTAMQAFIARLSPSAEEILAQLPKIAEGSVAGLAKSGMAAETVASEQLASRPMQVLMQRLDTAVTVPAQRLELVQTALSKSLAALANSAETSFANTVAPQLVTKTFDLATSRAATLDVDKNDSNKVNGFYDAMIKGAVTGLATMGSTKQAAAANAASAVMSKTIDAATTSMSALYAQAGSSISADVLKALPARASQALGEKLAKVLPPDDLNGVFAAATSQYLYNVQNIAATKATTVDVGELAKEISANSLATFSGAWNASPTDMQTAVTALNNKLGTMQSGIDSKVMAAVQNGVQNVVVQANGGKDSLTMCPSVGSVDLVACNKAAGAACPQAPDASLTPGYRLSWQADATGERCFMYRELKVEATAAGTSCADDREYVYGVGCRPKPTAACASGQVFVHGVGCQALTYFCPIGQKFTSGQGCVADSASYTCQPGQRRTASGNCEASISNCAAGKQFQNGQCVATSNIPICPVGSSYDNDQKRCLIAASPSQSTCAPGFYRDASSTCRAFGSCESGKYWDPREQRCRPATDCAAPMQWDSVSQRCLAVNANVAACTSSQVFFNGACRTCPEGSILDPSARSCRVVGSCSPGYTFDVASNQCILATPVECDVAMGGKPTAPVLQMPTSLVGGVQLSWSGSEDAFILLRRSGPEAISLNDSQPYDLRSVVGNGVVIMRGRATSYTDFEARDPTLNYYYQLHSVRFYCSGPKYSDPVSISGQPQAPIEATITASELAGVTDLALSPTTATGGIPSGIRVSWMPAVSTIDSSTVSASFYVIARHAPVANPSTLVAPVFEAASANIGAVLAGDWTVIYRGPMNHYFDASTNSEPDKNNQAYVYAIGAAYSSDSGPRFASAVAMQSNQVAPAGGGETLQFYGIDLAGLSSNYWLNADEKGSSPPSNLVSNLRHSGTAEPINYAVVAGTQRADATWAFDCGQASDYATEIPTTADAALVSGGRYVVCVRLTKEGATVYGQSASFGVDTILPTISGALASPFLGSTQGIAVADAHSVQWSQVSGPGTLVFASTNTVQTSLAVPVAGTYSIKLSAVDRAGNLSEQIYSFYSNAISASMSVSSVRIDGPQLLPETDCTRYYAQLYNGANQAVNVSAASSVTLAASGAMIFGDQNCSSSTSAVSIAAGQNNAEFFLKMNDPSHTTPLTVFANYSGISGLRTLMRPAHRLSLTTAQSVLSMGYCARVEISFRDQGNQPAMLAMAGTAELVAEAVTGQALTWYTDSSCSQQLTNAAALALPVNQTQLTYFIKPMTNGDLSLRIRDLAMTDPMLPSQLDIRVGPAIFAGAEHSCRIDSDGNLYCWGQNADGQLGIQTFSPHIVNWLQPISTGGGETFRTVALGKQHTCALLNDFRVKCWGKGNRGQLGNGALPSSPMLASAATAIDFGQGRRARALAAGEAHTCAILDDQSLACWGANNEGQLGNNTTTDAITPVMVDGQGARFRSVAAGANHTCAITAQMPPVVQCWGDNSHGQLGNGSDQDVLVPTAISMSNYYPMRLGTGAQHSCMIWADANNARKLSCWGKNDDEQIVDQAVDQVLTPTAIAVLTGETPDALALGNTHRCIRFVSGKVACWGMNNQGQLGYGNSASRSAPNAAITVDSGANAPELMTLGLAAGDQHTCVLTPQGWHKCWGDNQYGQLGNGNTSDVSAP